MQNLISYDNFPLLFLAVLAFYKFISAEIKTYQEKKNVRALVKGIFITIILITMFVYALYMYNAGMKGWSTVTSWTKEDVQKPDTIKYLLSIIVTYLGYKFGVWSVQRQIHAGNSNSKSAPAKNDHAWNLFVNVIGMCGGVVAYVLFVLATAKLF